MNFLVINLFQIQRFPRYVLLLSDLSKQTPEDHADYKGNLKFNFFLIFLGIKQALDQIKQVVDQLNEAKRVAENANKVAIIQNSLLDQVRKN